MESQCHMGTDLKEVRDEPKKCLSCGSVSEGMLTGYRCRVDGNYHNLEGQKTTEPVVFDTVAAPAPSPKKIKSAPTDPAGIRSGD